MKNIFIYSDEGAGDFSLYSAQNYFSSDNIKLISAAQIIQDGIPENTDLFIMPGGADIPYAKKLNGAGNDAIRHYVQQGGTYLGICAGGYYGCADIEFQKNTAHAICEARELQFCSGTAIGCLPDIAKQPYDQTLKSAAVTEITMGEKHLQTLYWGGCYFAVSDPQDIDIIATYSTLPDNPPAIIACKAGKGRAILSGVHFEISGTNLTDYDFGNDTDNQLKHDLAEKLGARIEVI